MADVGTMQDHIDDLMLEVQSVRERLKQAEIDLALFRVMFSRAIADRDAARAECARLRSVAELIVESVEQSSSVVLEAYRTVEGDRE